MKAALFCLAALGVAGCATLDTSKMSERCRDIYNACLDGCPKPMRSATPEQSRFDLDMVTPDCVDRCNKDVKLCR